MANQFSPWQKFLSRFGLGKNEKIPVRVDDSLELGYEETNWKIIQKVEKKRKF
jgi:hypothetical protein